MPVPTSGLVARWKLDGNALDAVGGFNGSAVNMTYAAGYLPGVQGGVFNGSSARVAVLHNAALKPTAGLSLVALVYKAAWTAPGASQMIMSCQETGGWVLYHQAANNFSVSVRVNGGYQYANALANGYTGWHLLAATYDGRYLKLYVDGVLAATTDAGGSYAIQYSVSNAIFIGAEADSGNDTTPASTPLYFGGKIAEAMIYNRAISDTEVVDIMNTLYSVVSPCGTLPLAGYAPTTDPFFAFVPCGAVPLAGHVPACVATFGAPCGALPLATLAPAAVSSLSVPCRALALSGINPAGYSWTPPAGRSWQQVYRLTLTGAADGLADVELPMSSFQSRARAEAQTYIGAQVPYTTAIASAIAARPGGTLVITGGPRYADGTENLAEVVRADLSRVDVDRGGRNASIALHGYFNAVTRPAQTRTMTGVSYVRTGETNQIRCAVDIWLRPGDTAIDPETGLSVVVTSISYVIGTQQQEMTVSDGNG